MTDRLRRERVLPEGYQFGDAGKVYGDGMTLRQYMAAESRDARVRAATVYLDRRWITKSESDAHPHWNVIEGEHE